MEKANKNIFIVVSFLVFGWFSLAGSISASPVYQNIRTAVGETGLGKDGNLLPIISYLISTVLGFLGIVLVIMIIYAGILWMTAGGDNTKVKKAKDIILQGVVGLLIVFASYSITTFVITEFEKATLRNQTTPVKLEPSNPPF